MFKLRTPQISYSQAHIGDVKKVPGTHFAQYICMKNYLLKTIIVNLVLSNSAYAYLQAGVVEIKNPQAVLKKAEQDGIQLSKMELALKRDILAKKQNKEFFKQQVFEGELSNSPDYQSYLYEAWVGISDIERAKILVKSQIANVIKDRWSQVKNTILNESAVEDFAAFEPNLSRRLETVLYSPIKQGRVIKTDDYRFRVEDWGFAVVSKDLKKITWKLSVSANNDHNKLEPGAEDIKIKGGSAPKSLQTLPAPTESAPVAPTSNPEDDY